MASDGAFTGPADEGSALPNTERLRDCSSQKEGQSRGPSVCPPLFWRGPEGAQLLLIQSFPVLEVVLQVPHKVRQVNKGCREKRGRRVFSAFLYQRLGLLTLSGNGTWAYSHPGPVFQEGLKAVGVTGTRETCSQPQPHLQASALQHLPLPRRSTALRTQELWTTLGSFSGSQPSGMATLSPFILEVSPAHYFLTSGCPAGGRARLLTIPGIKHVCDEVVDEGDLRLGDAAGVSVKHWHHHRQVQLFLFIGL